MAFLTDLFNPTFLMFLGILVLVVALLVVYFESKMREQNHKIASMLSLVSTLAEDMNNVKMGLNHLAIRGGAINVDQINDFQPEENLGTRQINQNLNLIEVSDDEESNNEETYNEESDNDETDNEETDNEETDNDSVENNQTKIIKLQVSNEVIDDKYDEVHNLEFEPNEDLGEFEGDFEPEVNNQYVEEVLDLKYPLEEIKNENSLAEQLNLSSSDVKTISINLGEEQSYNGDNIDYKKLQIQKLRSIVVEKGLTTNSEASKLKKNELLKLLGVE